MGSHVVTSGASNSSLSGEAIAIGEDSLNRASADLVTGDCSWLRESASSLNQKHIAELFRMGVPTIRYDLSKK